jgi:transcriptional regulator with XRE-family HTH domain
MYPISGRAAARNRLTQLELARRASVTTSYIGRLEAAGAAPGIDLLARLSDALGCPVGDLLPVADPPDTDAMLRERATELFSNVLRAADREMLMMLNPLLARLVDSAH